jgi:hypothetical protein
MQGGWQPPAPPAYANKPQQGLAIASMILGAVSITIGFCCYLGVLTSPIAIILGAISLVQIKNDPAHNGGKPFALVGVILGILYFLAIAFIILLYGIAFLTQGIK